MKNLYVCKDIKLFQFYASEISYKIKFKDYKIKISMPTVDLQETGAVATNLLLLMKFVREFHFSIQRT